MTDQNKLISEQLSLWGQMRSRVIRGNLIVIPIDNSFLFVEPVYLIAEGINIPQLKRIIGIRGDTVVMEPPLPVLCTGWSLTPTLKSWSSGPD